MTMGNEIGMLRIFRSIALLALVGPLFVTQPAAAQTPAPAQPGPAATGTDGQAAPRAGRRRRPPDKFAGQKRIRALVVSGGCCHDYRGQDKIFMDLMADILPVDWTILYEGGTTRDARVALYNKPNWAEGFDVVIHNECYGAVGDDKFIRQITSAHEAGVPAMVIHCSMHSYRATEADDWREFLGVTSRRHTRRHYIAVKVTSQESSLTAGIPADWTTPSDELYVIEKVWPNSTVLATATSPEEGNDVYPVVWTNDFHGARVFGTTLGHGETFDDPVFRDLLVRGFKWAVKRE